MQHEDPLLKSELANGTVRTCLCGALIQKDGGCEYVRCPVCAQEWCWRCGLRKWTECNDGSHNSH